MQVAYDFHFSLPRISNLHSGGKMASMAMHLNYICAYNEIN